MCLQTASVNKWEYCLYPDSAASECARTVPDQVHSYIPTRSGVFKVNLTTFRVIIGSKFSVSPDLGVFRKGSKRGSLFSSPSPLGLLEVEQKDKP